MMIAKSNETVADVLIYLTKGKSNSTGLIPTSHQLLSYRRRTELGVTKAVAFSCVRRVT
jgi:hypothetical protein